MSKDPREYILDLVKEAITDLERGSARLSEIVHKASRIARLREDYINFWWLSLELISIVSKAEVIEIQSFVAPRIPLESYETLRKRFCLGWIREREIVTYGENFEPKDEKNVKAMGVGQIEVEIEKFSRLSEQPPLPDGLHANDLYMADLSRTENHALSILIIAEYKNILERIKVRVHSYLTDTEAQLVYGQLRSDLFEQNKNYVEIKLREYAPQALAQLESASQRVSDGDPEALSQALMSCRRSLKSIADALYPPQAEPVEGADGVERDLSEEKYIARLWQFIYENVGGSTSGDLLLSQVPDLGNRLDRLYDLACKGVHVDVSDIEVSQCVVQTYLLAGDIIRIHDRTTAVGQESIIVQTDDTPAA